MYTISVTVESVKSGNRTGGSYFVNAKDEKELLKKVTKKMVTKVAGMTRRGVSFNSSDKQFKLFLEAKEDVIGRYDIIISSKFEI